MAKRTPLSQEIYCRDSISGIGPLLEVTEAKEREAAWFSLEVGDWGITVRIGAAELRRLRDQLSTILGDETG